MEYKIGVKLTDNIPWRDVICWNTHYSFFRTTER